MARAELLELHEPQVTLWHRSTDRCGNIDQMLSTVLSNRTLHADDRESMIIHPPSPGILDAIRLTRAALPPSFGTSQPEAGLFAKLLLSRLEDEQREGDHFALDLWLNELARNEPLADYKGIINVLWVTMMRNSGSASLDDLAMLLERRDRLIRTVELASPKPEVNTAQMRFEAAHALQIILANYAPGHVQHVEEIARVAVAIARHLNMSFDDTRVLWASGLVHDIGMVMIPRRIIESRTGLSDEDFELMKGHVDHGVAILRAVGSLRNCIPIVASHHERYDGGGYPAGLKGDAIPLGSRVLSVADSVQAMLAPRPYRAALEIRDIQNTLFDGRGKQWDPQVVDVAIKLMDEGEIHSPFRSVQPAVEIASV